MISIILLILPLELLSKILILKPFFNNFLAIAERYRSIIISDVPVFEDDQRDIARRFMVLVDTLYDTKTHVIISASAQPTELYSGYDWRFEFDRTVSRLMEMQSVEYIQEARGSDR